MKRSILIRFSTIFLTIVVLFTLYQYIAKTVSKIYKSETVTPSETKSMMEESTIVVETTVSSEETTTSQTDETITETSGKTIDSTETTTIVSEPTSENESNEADNSTFSDDIDYNDIPEDEFTISPELNSESQNRIGVVADLNYDVLNVRTEPSTKSEKITGLPNDYLVIICETIHTSDETNSVWYKIMFKNTVGYASAKYIEILEDVYTLDSKEGENWTLISTATTQKTSSANREYNIALACSMINQKTVSPGELFSWNDTIGGECCENNGFKEAPVFITNPDGTIGNGVDFGGGVCQVSTTINIAIRGLGIKTNASPHGKRVSYATLEEEASISYPYTDFSFINTLDKTIILEMISFKGSCMCNVYIQN